VLWLREQWDSGDAGITHPLLFECDREGHVVWMSHHARAVLGDEKPLQAAMADYLRMGKPFRVWPAYVMAETLLFAAQPESGRDAGPIRLEADLLRGYGRLDCAERRLSAQLRRRPGRRASTLRQVERERQRLASELHTGVGQMLAAIRMQLEVIATQMPNPVEGVQKALERIGRLAQDALEEVRSISHRLYPPEWQRFTIEEALRQLWEVTGIQERFEARLRLDRLPREPAQEIKVLLYRAAQEALSNIARHSSASRVEMTLEILNDKIVMSIHDDGHGFDAGRPEIDSGLGLRSVRDAAADVSAKFDVESSPGSTTLRVQTPFEAK
jgi:signal transduction histidine kinase